ncbi:MAG: O-acetylhomoserine aminocarboxypropyltransferase/cysteine synthase [Clostridia bacterium]|nr:O-acetylhomoserine aminocarboxypropyltransferase/cysteine synthase [Clostridia bacterium]
MKSIDTKCVQAGYDPKNGEPRVLPIVQSTTYVYETPEAMGDLFDLKASGYFYTRIGNPTNAGLEDKVNALEGGVGALATASGMSATMLAVLNLASSGDNFIASSNIYGGTYNLFNVTLRRMGIDCRFVDNDTAPQDVEELVDDKTKFIFIETIANPAGKVADFEKFSTIAKKYGLVLMCDNTISTPYICRPFEHGVNVIVHASTKYLDGHATSVGGLVVDGGNFNYLGNPRYPLFNNPDDSYHGMVFARDFGNACFVTRARVVGMRDLGAIMAPMNAFLTVLGIDTLHLRMPRHSENALALAKALKNSDAVEWVKYAGLEDDPDYPRAQKYFDKGYCAGMVSFGIKGGKDAAMKFQKALGLFKIVTHIADSRSCVLHPATTTHRQLSDKDLEAAGVPANLIRLSVGTEGIEDILADVLGALEVSQK